MNRLLLLIVPLLLIVAPAWAQEQGQDAQDPTLPDIAPREIEIRGPLEVSFPSLERQPLVGFNPPPRIPLIPMDRRPYVEDYKQDNADLPPSPLDRPEAPPVNSVEGLEPIMGELELTVGRYLTRSVHGNAGIPISPTESVYGTLLYDGSNGHAPFEDDLGTGSSEEPEAVSSFDAVEGIVGIRTNHARVAAGAELETFWRDYLLYGAVRRGIDIDQYPRRVGTHVGTSVWLRTQGEAPVKLYTRLGYGSTLLDTDIYSASDIDNDPALEAATERMERRLDFDLDFVVPFGRQQVQADVHASTAGLDEDGVLGSSVTSLDLGGGATFRYRQAFDVLLGARVMSFTAPDLDADAGDGDASLGSSYISPAFDVRTFPVPGLLVYVQNQPGIDRNPLAKLMDVNPYLLPEPAQQPTVRTIDAEGGMSVFVGRVRLKAQVGYQRSPNWLFFEQPADSPVPYQRGFIQASYGKVNIMHAGGGASVVFPFGLQASASASVRRGRLREDDIDIPYFAPIVGEAMLAYVVADRRLRLQLSGTYERARYRDRTNTGRVGDFFDLDFEASYNLTRQFGALVRIENISADRLEYWDHYPQPDLVLSGGLRLVW